VKNRYENGLLTEERFVDREKEHKKKLAKKGGPQGGKNQSERPITVLVSANDITPLKLGPIPLLRAEE
jgi:hypothetical protein